MSKERIKEATYKSREYGLIPLVKIDVEKAKEQAKIIYQADKQNIFSDFVFKSVEYLEELEIQRQLIQILNDDIIDENERLKGEAGYNPLTPLQISALNENTELLTGNIELAQKTLNVFLGSHYEKVYKKGEK